MINERWCGRMGIYTLRCDKCYKTMGVVKTEDSNTEVILDNLVDSGKMIFLCSHCFVNEPNEVRKND